MKTHRFFCGVALFFLLVGVYWLTYRGYPLSQDGIFIYDMTESLVNRGNFNRTYEFSRFNTLSVESTDDPWAPPVQEPLIAVLLAPLYWIGRSLPGVGTMHVVWLFNGLITALTAISLYAGALLLRYPLRLAWFAGLIYGVSTLAFPYARFLFREPLLALFVLWCFIFAALIQRVWQNGTGTSGSGQPHLPDPSRLRGEGEQVDSRRFLKSPLHLLEREFRGEVGSHASLQNPRLPGYVALLTLTFVAALLTKAVSLAILPALLILLLPARLPHRVWLAVVGGLALLVMLWLAADALDLLPWRYSLAYWLGKVRHMAWGFVVESLLGYQISFSRSIWLHSPVLIAGLLGAWMMLKQRQWRQVVSPALLLLIFSILYGMAQRVSWWGSWGWGPRYMLPVIPVLMLLWVLPVMEKYNLTPAIVRMSPPLHAMERGWGGKVIRFGFLLLILLGIILQLLGMAVPLPNYYTDLNRAGLLTEWTTEKPWGAYNWSWQWSPIRYHLERVDFRHLDSAWVYAHPGWIAPLLAVMLITISAVWAWWWRPRPADHEAAGMHGGAPLRLVTIPILCALVMLALAAIGAGLATLRDDSRYIAEWPDVRELARQLDSQAQRDQVVFIDREQYLPIFMNYFKTPAVVAALPYSPAENYGSGPEVISEDIVERIGFDAYYALTWTAMHHESVWLVASSSPFEAGKIRPVERFLAENYFPVSEIFVSDRARAIRFRMVSVQQVGTAQTTDYAFDHRLKLEGFNLPLGTTYAPGDVVLVTLVWQPLETLPEDYSVGVHIAAADGFPLAQRDGQPQGTFGAMTRWQVGEYYFDHHGIPLPVAIPQGDYQIQVVVYRWQDGTRLSYGDGDIARLIGITVQ